MDFLLDPNIAYLFLLGAVLLALLALATPGTGLLEAGAFFCMALAGYAIYNLSINLLALGVVVLSVIPFVYAIQRPKREAFLGLAILMIVAGSLFIFPSASGGPAVNPVVAVVATVLVAGFLWVAVRKSMEAAHKRPSHDLDGLVGRSGEARTKVKDDGSVFVSGELWSAKSSESIPAGAAIRVVRREGFVLVVEKENPDKTSK